MNGRDESNVGWPEDGTKDETKCKGVDERCDNKREKTAANHFGGAENSAPLRADNDKCSSFASLALLFIVCSTDKTRNGVASFEPPHLIGRSSRINRISSSDEE